MVCFGEGVLLRQNIGGNQLDKETTEHTGKRVHLCEDGSLSFLCSRPVFSLFSYVQTDVPQVLNGFPNMFLNFPTCSPRLFSIAPYFIPYALPKALTFSALYEKETHTVPE